MRVFIAAAAVVALLAPAYADAQTPVTVVHAFGATHVPFLPEAPIIEAADGNFYGTTAFGGAYDRGTVFRMTPAGAVTIVHHFAIDEGRPWGAPLLQGADGNLYGTTPDGAYYADGVTVFKITANGTLTTVCTMGSLSVSGLVQSLDNAIFGTSYDGQGGSIFQVTPAGCVWRHFFRNDIATPEGYDAGPLLAGADGYLYGTTFSGGPGQAGTVYRMAPGTLNIQVLHAFTGGADGGGPGGGPLVQKPDGTVFGTTTNGGAGGRGTVFCIGVDQQFATFHAFSEADGLDQFYPASGLAVGSDGALYEIIGRTFFRLSASGDFQLVLPSNSFTWYDPNLTPAANGTMYVTTSSAGGPGLGTIFRVHTDDGTVDRVYDFAGDAGGDSPRARLLQTSGGTLYGTTDLGGAPNLGTVFVATPAGQFGTLHAFSGADGAHPAGAVIRATDGNFYGMTSEGGTSDVGVVYRMTAAGAVTVLHAFAGGSDGSHPVGALVQAADGALFGATRNGGTFNDRGTAFRITLDGTMSILHSFGAPGDAAFPASGLIQASDGNFYGVTDQGPLSSYGYGEAYRMTPDGSVTIVYDLNRFDGDYSYFGVNPLIQGRDGNLYGTTEGLKSSRGTFFRITLGGVATVLHEFRVNAESPIGPLVEGRDGFFYVAFWPYGGFGRLSPSGDLTILQPGYGPEGCCAHGGLIQAVDGDLYGTADYYGPDGGGSLFRIQLRPTAPASVVIASGRDGVVRLTWAAVPVSTRYRISRGTTSGGETVLLDGFGATTFSDTTAVRGQHYFYVITAINDLGESIRSYEVSITAGRAVAADFDGDARTDLAVFRPGSGTWYVWQSSTDMSTATSTRWGAPGDQPFQADIDGDGIADPIVWRPADGTWYWLTSSTNYAYANAGSKQWGNTSLGDVPMVGDIDGDGKADLIAWRASTGTWYWLTSSTNYDYASTGSKQWGNSSLGDVPMVGDYDGDGKADPAVWRASTGTWYWLTSSSGYSYASANGVQWGVASLGDRPVLADYDGDGKADPAVWRASTGTWYWLTSSTGYAYASAGSKQWGNSSLGDVPIIGDYDGDGRADLAIWRSSTGTWYWLTSSSGYSYNWAVSRQWGAPTDVPLVK